MSEKHKEQGEKAKDQKKTLTVPIPEDANVEYVDSVRINWTPEIAILAFFQRYAITQSAQDENEQKFQGRLVGQMAFTWPHLVRLRNLLNNTIEENKESVIKETLDAFGKGEDDAK